MCVMQAMGFFSRVRCCTLWLVEVGDKNILVKQLYCYGLIIRQAIYYNPMQNIDFYKKMHDLKYYF